MKGKLRRGNIFLPIYRGEVEGDTHLSPCLALDGVGCVGWDACSTPSCPVTVGSSAESVREATPEP